MKVKGKLGPHNIIYSEKEGFVCQYCKEKFTTYDNRSKCMLNKIKK